MIRGERRLVREVRDAATRLLEAEGFAETYLRRIDLADAIGRLVEWSNHRPKSDPVPAHGMADVQPP